MCGWPDSSEKTTGFDDSAFLINAASLKDYLICKIELKRRERTSRNIKYESGVTLRTMIVNWFVLQPE